jgi:ethanolamine utilization protein EutA
MNERPEREIVNEPVKGQPHGHSGAFAGLHSHDGGALHWHDEFGEHLAEDLTPEEFAARQIDWKTHNVVIVTVGVDIGSSTSHLMFSRIFMRLIGEPPDVESVVVGREILWQSPVMLTPYLPDGSIDAAALAEFVSQAYAEVGATAKEVDTGVVILTGEALKRNNAASIAELFALRSGQFVSASAGHHMEAMLAANGSGTVARSRRDQRTLLNVDIGGGTTKLALVRDGEVLGTAAIAVGARQIVMDEQRVLTRLDEPAREVAAHLGIEVELGQPLSNEDEKLIVAAWTDMIAGLISGRATEGIVADLMLTDPLPREVPPQAVTFSGGVSEFIFFRESRDFGDLGQPLAEAIRKALSGGAISLPAIIEPNLGIRATAVGASLFPSQVGVNLHLTDEMILPLVNVPVVVPKLLIDNQIESEAVTRAIQHATTAADLTEGEAPVAIRLRLADELTPAAVRTLAEAVCDALPRTIENKVPFVVAIDETVASRLGEVLAEHMGVDGDFLTLEGITVPDFAYIDVGEVIHPAEVVPVTVKSLLVAGGLDRRSVKQAVLAAMKRPS